MTVLLIIITLIMLLIAGIDVKKGEIPNTLSIFLLICGIVGCFLNAEKNVLFGVTAAICVFFSQAILFYICGEDAIGGGDVKILSISFLYLYSYSEMMIYLLILSVVSIFGYVLTKMQKKSHVRFGPYMGISLVFTLWFILAKSIILATMISAIYVVLVIIFGEVWKILEKKVGGSIEESI